MAEIVPLILLFGSLYVISNKEKNKENLSNMQNRKNVKNNLPNTAVSNINYNATQDNNESIPIDSSSRNYVQQYPNSNQTTDKLFNSNYKNEININRWLVKNGWALAYRKYSKDYIGEEEWAKNNNKGLWQGDFLEPWKWRKK